MIEAVAKARLNGWALTDFRRELIDELEIQAVTGDARPFLGYYWGMIQLLNGDPLHPRVLADLDQQTRATIDIDLQLMLSTNPWSTQLKPKFLVVEGNKLIAAWKGEARQASAFSVLHGLDRALFVIWSWQQLSPAAAKHRGLKKLIAGHKRNSELIAANPQAFVQDVAVLVRALSMLAYARPGIEIYQPDLGFILKKYEAIAHYWQTMNDPKLHVMEPGDDDGPIAGADSR